MYDFKTSLPAYEEAKLTLNKKQQIVFDAIVKLGTCTDQQISNELGWPINRVTPRRGELFNDGKIDRACRDKDRETGRTVNYWKVS